MAELSDASVIVSDTGMPAQVSAFIGDRVDELLLVSADPDDADAEVEE